MRTQAKKVLNGLTRIIIAKSTFYVHAVSIQREGKTIKVKLFLAFLQSQRYSQDRT